MRLEFYRSTGEFEGEAYDYGWSVTLIVRGKHRLRWNSTRATTRMWPRVVYGSDQDCNRAFTFVAWPLGALDIWWEPRWRAAGSGMCDPCLREFEEMNR